ncbi:hypothetical protein TRFO_30601 [Tritrichomonas foetus]|uniref:Uncharacterized protein n=1 Tax=Tritrichomonas foetus TaxID=1144522 RepID=A0A1J4JXM8_9EUKA|nr:hypothetical protein TRFO_30601 [Tritrichomonas foetus]|eukprot:OHT02286.1 hypothetical protein TRFO_30601 [Tritrichomonas foetus]
MNDYDEFSICLNILANKNADESQISRALLQFEKSIFASIFSSFSHNQIQICFMKIWNILFNLSINSSTTIRLESSRAASIFITRMIPFYNESLQKSFSKITESIKYETPLILASFAIMTKHISPPLVLQYINICIIENLNINDSCYPFIIDNLGILGLGVLQYLFKALLNQFQTDQNRHLIRSIGSVVRHSPEVFLPQVLNLNSLTLFAYIFTNMNIDPTNYNISHVLDLICTTLSSESSSPLDRDSSLQILSTLNPTVELISNDLIKITFCNDRSIILVPSKNLDRPPFFSLMLPLELLEPNENESVLILSSKFKTIAKSANEQNISQILDIFNKYLSLPYNEVVSAAIIGISSEIKRINSPELVNKIIYSKIVNWFHAFDVLRIIRNHELNKHTLKLLYGFIISGNVKLSDESIDVVRSLINHSNFEEVESFFTHKIDIFNENHLERILATLNSIFDGLNKINCQNSSQCNIIMNVNNRWLIKTLFEAVLVYKNDFQVLTYIFNYLSKRDFSFVNPEILKLVTQHAFKISTYYLDILYGEIADQEKEKNPSKSHERKKEKSKDKIIENENDLLIEFIKNDIGIKSFDIMNEIKNIDEFLPSFASATKFVLNAPLHVLGSNQTIDFVLNAFKYFPRESSFFIENNWSYLTDTHRNPIIQTLFLKLQFVNDYETIAAWCRILVRTPNIFHNQQYLKTIGIVNFASAYYLVPQFHDMKCAASFSAYLQHSINDSSSTIKSFLAAIDEKSKELFITELSKIDEKMLQLYNLQLPESNIPSECIEIHNQSDVIQNTQTSFDHEVNLAIYKGNSYELIRVLKKALENNISFNIFDYCLPNKMCKDISKWLVKNCPLSITQEKLLSYLSLIRTEWKMVAINAFQNNSLTILEQLQNIPNIKYNTILDISTLSNYVNLSQLELFKLAARLSMSCVKTKKMRASFLLMANSLSKKVNISDNEFPRNFVERINPLFDIIPVRETSFVLHQLSLCSNVDNIFLFFCRKLLIHSVNSPETGLLGSILYKHNSELLELNKTLVIDYQSIVQNLLSDSPFVLPSKIMSACRIINSEKTFKNTLYPLMNRFDTFHRLPIVNDVIIKTITRGAWHERFREMKRFFDIDFSVPEFPTILKLAFFVLKSLNPEDEIAAKCFSLFTNILKDPKNIVLLNSALSCLMAALTHINEINKIQTIAMDALIEWINNLKLTDGPLTLFFAYEFTKILELKMDANSFFGLITFQLIKSAPRFFSIFPVVVKYYLKYQKCSWSKDILSACDPIINAKCHKGALKALLDGKINEAIKLSMYETDCEESDSLLKEYKITID